MDSSDNFHEVRKKEKLGDMEFRRVRWEHSRMTIGMRILLALGRVGFKKEQMMSIALTPQSLMYGYGPQVVSVLDMLTSKLCNKIGMDTKPNYSSLREDNINIVEEDMAEEMKGSYEDDISDDSIVYEEEEEKGEKNMMDSTKMTNRHIITSDIDASEWKREVSVAIEAFRNLEGAKRSVVNGFRVRF